MRRADWAAVAGYGVVVVVFVVVDLVLVEWPACLTGVLLALAGGAFVTVAVRRRLRDAQDTRQLLDEHRRRIAETMAQLRDTHSDDDERDV